MLLQHQVALLLYCAALAPTCLAGAEEIIKTPQRPLCPLGFTLSYTSNKRPICYNYKGPETFQSKFDGCVGNLYTSELYQSLRENMTKFNFTFWSDYKTLYPEGPFTDLTTATDYVLDAASEVIYGKDLNRSENLCIITNEDGGYQAVNCNDKYYRYCFVDPYPVIENLTNDGCEELPSKYRRFHSPTSLCMMNINKTEGRKVNVTWQESLDMCESANGTLMSTGWRYANNPWLGPSNSAKSSEPLALSFDNNYSVISDSTTRQFIQNHTIENEVPRTIRYNETNYVINFNPNRYGWINEKYIFHNIICQYSVPLKYIQLKLSINSFRNVIELYMNDTVMEPHENIHCYTDSESFNTLEVKVNHNGSSYIEPLGSGYYWCVHTDHRHFQTAESNKILYIGESNVTHLYAVRVNLREKTYTIDFGLDDFSSWENDLRKYINGNIKLDVDKKHVSMNVTLKRYYLENQPFLKALLFHVDLDRALDISPGEAGDLEIVSVKPAYYCKETSEIKINRTIYPHGVPLNESVPNTSGCQTFKCVGDFNEGVQWIKQKEWNCTLPTFEEVTDHFEELLNDSKPIKLHTIRVAFKQVNKLLKEENPQFTSKLLNLIDQMALRIDIKDTKPVSVVTNNIAVMAAVVGPQNPIRGLKIASDRPQDNQTFHKGDFEMFSDTLDPVVLNSDKNQEVVELPTSVSDSNRRISFVVFSNDKAFKSTEESDMLYTVNNKVISISVENLTTFKNGETIDIYMRPTTSPTRTQKKSCAFWQFADDQTGHWSHDGCTFIRGNNDTMLDICRCNHLTHFAEVLVPRSVFSQANEDALELISIIGCVMSLIGLTAIALTAFMFRSWRKDFINKMWLQLCIAIATVVLCYLIIVPASFDTDSSSCILMGLLLHYSVLASFFWMLVAGVISYYRLVLVFNNDSPHMFLKYSCFAWGTPCLIVGILLLVDPHSYEGRFEEKAPSGSFCYPSGLHLFVSVYAPISLILLVNCILFIMIFRSVYVRALTVQKHGDMREAFSCLTVSCLLIFLFGLPWVFGLFAYNIVGAYLFTLTATFQGFVLFIFFVVANKKTRDLWLNKFYYVKQTRSGTVSTGSNNLAPSLSVEDATKMLLKELKIRNAKSCEELFDDDK